MSYLVPPEIQKAFEPRDTADPRGDAQNAPTMDDLASEQALILAVKHDDVTDTDEGLETQLKQDKKLSPMKVPFCNSPGRSNKPVVRSLKGNSRKLGGGGQCFR